MLLKSNFQYSIYEYFKTCYGRNRYARGVGVITHKQKLFYSQLKQEDDSYYDHIGIANELHKLIHHDKSRSMYQNEYPNDVHLFSLGQDLSIDLPENGTFSKMQYDFICEVLDELKQLNSEIIGEDRKILVIVFNYNKKVNSPLFNEYTLDFDALKIILQKMITNDLIIEDECIMGNTLKEEEIVYNFQYQLELNKCQTTKDLAGIISLIDSFIKDDYFKKYLLEIMPNYNNICLLANVLSIFNVPMSEISITNLEDDLLNIFNNVFNNLNVESFKNFVMRINFNKEELNAYLPNFSYFMSFIKKYYYMMVHIGKDDYFYNDFCSIHSYQDVLSIMPSIINKKMQEKMESLAFFAKMIEKNDDVQSIQLKKEEDNRLVTMYDEIQDEIKELELLMSIFSNRKKDSMEIDGRAK